MEGYKFCNKCYYFGIEDENRKFFVEKRCGHVLCEKCVNQHVCAVCSQSTIALRFEDASERLGDPAALMNQCLRSLQFECQQQAAMFDYFYHELLPQMSKERERHPKNAQKRAELEARIEGRARKIEKMKHYIAYYNEDKKRRSGLPHNLPPLRPKTPINGSFNESSNMVVDDDDGTEM